MTLAKVLESGTVGRIGEEWGYDLRRQPSGAEPAPPAADAAGTGLRGRMHRPDPPTS